jgi:short-subunit dehydrogenase
MSKRATGRYPELHEALAVVTGASSGIGAAYAKLLAEQGSDLVLVARRRDRLEALAAELQKRCGVHVHCVALDLSERNAAERLLDEATGLGSVRVLVNNAGLGAYGPFLDRPIETHLKTVDVNSRVLMETCWHFGQHMREHGQPSWINNVASIAAYQSTPGYAVYSGSKFFVRVFSETLSHELAKTPITVSCLCPGATYTEFMEKAKIEVTDRGHATFMSAEAVAQIGLRGLMRGKAVVVPGALNKLAAFLPRFTPTPLSLSIADIVMKKSVREV